MIERSPRSVSWFACSFVLGTDWWAMRLDGTGNKRLTTMNLNRPNNPENFGMPQIAGTIAIAPPGDFFLGDVQENLATQSGLIRTVHLTCP